MGWACERSRWDTPISRLWKRPIGKCSWALNFTRPASIEVEAAERLLEVIDGADMVKFAKNGSDVTTAAVKLARAYTGRD